MHTSPIVEKTEETQAHRDFLNWVKSFLEAEKYATFEKLIKYPLPTNEICETIFQEYPRALQAENKYIKYTFANQEIEQKFGQYLDDIGFHDFWNGKAMEALANSINSFIVCDMPSIQKGVRPEAYFYLLNVDCVIDGEVCEDEVEWLCFYQDLTEEEERLKCKSKKALFDGHNMYVYIQDDKGTWTESLNKPHGLDYCPICKFYPKLISEKNPWNSKSPITPALGDLDRWLFWDISIEHFQLYGAFPIYWGYKKSCDYVNPENGGTCDSNGVVTHFEVEEGTTQQKAVTAACPKCKNKQMVGAGTFIEVAPPQMKDDADLRDPIGKLDVQVEALEFLYKRHKQDESKIIYNCTGKASESLLTTEAVNETQAKSAFETRQIIISTIARQLEKSMWFTISTLAKLKYGDLFKSCTVDLGNNFFLKSVEELNKDYSDASLAGRPQFELAQKRDFIFVTENQGNPEMIMKYQILKALEPYQGQKMMDLKTLGVDVMDSSNYIIKLNFNDFIDRFERENMGLLEFGANITFSKKIELIKKQLEQYAREKNQSQPTPRDGDFVK